MSQEETEERSPESEETTPREEKKIAEKSPRAIVIESLTELKNTARRLAAHSERLMAVCGEEPPPALIDMVRENATRLTHVVGAVETQVFEFLSAAEAGRLGKRT